MISGQWTVDRVRGKGNAGPRAETREKGNGKREKNAECKMQNECACGTYKKASSVV